MLTLTCKISGAMPLEAAADSVSDSVSLPHDIRCRTRLRVTLASGREAGIVLARSERLRPGDYLRSDDGTVVMVTAAIEPLLEATAAELLTVTRAAYHLGNRHVPVQIVDLLTLRLPVDHVLADMLRGLGLQVKEISAPFSPEGGAYGQPGSDLHATDHTHMLDREAPIRLRRTQATEPIEPANTPAGLVDPGVGDHRSPRRIHEFAEVSLQPPHAAAPPVGDAKTWDGPSFSRVAA